MRERFSRIEDGQEVQIEVFLDAKSKMEFYPWILSVFIKYDTANASEESLREFFDVREILIDAIEFNEEAVYVGNRIVGEWSEVYFYAQDSKGLESSVNDILRPTGYIYETSVVKDAEWEFFTHNIFPTDFELCIMQSQKIIEYLQDEGDTLGAVREVEHYVSFPTPTQKERFISKIESIGFKYKDDINDDEIPNGIAVVKEHKVTIDELEKIIQPLFELIESEGGEYELWSTTLVE